MVVNDVYFTASALENGIVVGNDEILKVVNVTDGSYRLKDGEYSVADGRLVISESYLKTLEQNAEYAFRAVTAETDYDFIVKTNFTGAVIAPLQEEFTKGESISFTLSGAEQVFKIEINGKEYAFTFEENVVTVSAEALADLTSGNHVLKVYTANGRPTVSFSLAGLPDYKEDAVEAVNHAFFWVDIAVFASLIAGYAVFATVKKYGKKQGVKV